MKQMYIRKEKAYIRDKKKFEPTIFWSQKGTTFGTEDVMEQKTL
jgi:hypothetical protein